MAYGNEYTMDYSGLTIRCKDLVVDNGTTNLSTTELGYIDGSTPGTVVASKAVVVDSNKDVASFRNVTVTNLDAGASGTAGSVDVFPTTASKGKLTLSCTDQTGNTVVTLNADAMGQATTVHIADPGAAASYIVQSTAAVTLAEADTIHSVTAGTVAASKAVVVDANKDIASFRNVTLAGALTLSAGGTLVSDSGTATATTGAATLSKMAGIVTSESLTTAAGATYTLTLTNTLITANSNILVTVGYGTSTTGVPVVQKVTPGAGSASIVILNTAAAAALNGTILIQFFIAKP